MRKVLCGQINRRCSEGNEQCCYECIDRRDCREACVNIPKSCGHSIDENAKEIQGKPRLSLVPPSLIEAVGRVRTYGTQKYKDPDNWKKVKSEHYVDAVMRHWCKYMKDPQSVDEESGLKHIEHVACNVAFLIEMGDEA